MKKDYKYVELFAGCGGMSLGLESAGFTRLMANELSPMAAETFAYNLVEGAREVQPAIGDMEPWKKHFSFIESPSAAFDGTINGKLSRNREVDKQANNILEAAKRALTSGQTPNLLVGDATKLADEIEKMTSLENRTLWKEFDHLDILAGGPPCQSFSLAGKRQRDNPRNSLFHSFVRIAKALSPRVILFENVLGITKPFRDDDSEELHPWHEVCRAFRAAGFIPVPALVNAADFGVPQSRLRFILIGLREDLAEGLLTLEAGTAPLREAIELGRTRYKKANKWVSGDDTELIFRTESDADIKRWPEPLFPALTTHSTRTSVAEAIEDLLAFESGEIFRPGPYAQMLDRQLKRPIWMTSSLSIENHRLRKHGDRTRARFRLMRVLAKGGFRAKSMADVMKNRDKAIDLLNGKQLFLPIQHGGFSEKLAKASFWDARNLLEQLTSAKHAQRCLDPMKPAPAQLSIPDDLIHWEADRVLSVREMARIQSFPDWFVFRSKETTGGTARAYEVPQYTQVGNAVPPLLAKSLGEAIIGLLRRYDEVERH